MRMGKCKLVVATRQPTQGRSRALRLGEMERHHSPILSAFSIISHGDNTLVIPKVILYRSSPIDVWPPLYTVVFSAYRIIYCFVCRTYSHPLHHPNY